MMTEKLPISKSGVAETEEAVGRYKHLPFAWRLVERMANAVVPLLVLSVVAGFTFALFVTLFAWAWEIIR